MSVCAALLLHALAAGDLAPTDEDFAWQDQYTFEELERQMPVSEYPYSAVVFRAHRDLYYDVIETYFRIRIDMKDPALRLRAELVVPIEFSIQEQVLRLHMEDREASIEAIRPRLRVVRHEISEAACPAVRKQWRAFANLRVPLPADDGIVLHPMIYRIRSAGGDGSIDAVMTDEDHELVRWALKTHDELRRCAERR